MKTVYTLNAGMLLLLVTLSGYATAEPDVHTGLWEITVKSKMQGMPMQVPAITHRQCITKEDLVPKSQDPGQECTIEDHTVSGNTVTWRIRCVQQGNTMAGQGRITYKRDT